MRGLSDPSKHVVRVFEVAWRDAWAARGIPVARPLLRSTRPPLRRGVATLQGARGDLSPRSMRPEPLGSHEVRPCMLCAQGLQFAHGGLKHGAASNALAQQERLGHDGHP